MTVPFIVTFKRVRCPRRDGSYSLPVRAIFVIRRLRDGEPPQGETPLSTARRPADHRPLLKERLMEKIYSLDEAAALFPASWNVNKRKLTDWIKTGRKGHKLECIRVSNRCKGVTESQIERFLDFFTVREEDRPSETSQRRRRVATVGTVETLRKKYFSKTGGGE